MNEVKKNFSKWMYWFILAVCIILVYKFLDNFKEIRETVIEFCNIIAPFLLGTLIAYLLYIPESKIEKKIVKIKFLKKHARGISVLLTYVLAILLIALLINVILPVITDSIVELVSNFQTYWNQTMQRINDLPEDSILKSDNFTEKIKEIGSNIATIDFKQYLNPEKLSGYVKGAFGVATGIFDGFVTIIVSIYILLERNSILNFFGKTMAAIFDTKTCNKIAKYLESSNTIFGKFISSQLIDAVVVGVLTTIAMSIIGVKYAILLGFMIGLFNIIPYFGAIIAVAISILITLITGGLSQAIIMAIVVIVLQQIDANVINPKIIGNSLEISPLLIIFAVTVGGAYFGVLGMFLAVPVVAVLKIAINDYIEYKIKVKYNI